MAEFKNNLLSKLIKKTELCGPAQVPDIVARHFANEDAVGIIEAVSQVFWARVKNGQIIPMSDAQLTMTDPENWLGARFFNDKGELRLSRSEKGFRLAYLSEDGLSTEALDYRDTYWLLSGGKPQKKEGLEQEMSEFQVAAYRMPLTGGNSARLTVRQYIDYENETGLAKIVAERLVKLGEEENNG